MLHRGPSSEFQRIAKIAQFVSLHRSPGHNDSDSLLLGIRRHVVCHQLYSSVSIR